MNGIGGGRLEIGCALRDPRCKLGELLVFLRISMKSGTETRVLLKLRRAFAKEARVRSGALIIESGEKGVRGLTDQAVLLQFSCREVAQNV